MIKYMEQLDKEFINGTNTNDLFNKLNHLYKDKEDFTIDLNFFLDNIIKKKSETKCRLNQNDFRKKVIETYKVCIVSGYGDLDELEACHIIPHTSLNTHIDNGLLLNRMIHKTFDKYLWSIHPETLKIEVSDSINKNSSIMQFKGQIVSIRKESIYYIKQHYSKFKETMKLNN